MQITRKIKYTDGKNRTVTIVPEMKYIDIMREKLNTDLGRKIYSKSQVTVESTHGFEIFDKFVDLL